MNGRLLPNLDVELLESAPTIGCINNPEIIITIVINATLLF
jgi:hypothetical protein